MWHFFGISRSRDLEKLLGFAEKINKAEWSDKSLINDLNTIFQAMNELAHHEILYYSKAREMKLLISWVTRGCAWFFGSAGIMFPFLAGVNPDTFKNMSPWGYILLVAAAAMLVSNRLFTATSGHIRYAAAQLDLERLASAFQLNWAAWLAENRKALGEENIKKESVKKAFEIFQNFSEEVYKIIQKETNAWGIDVQKALEGFIESQHSQLKTIPKS